MTSSDQIPDNESSSHGLASHHRFFDSVEFFLSESVDRKFTENPISIPLPSTFGKFKMLEIVGEGGMGIVFRARQMDIGREVAVKLIKDIGANASELKVLIHKEAELGAAIQHPNIVTIYECGDESGIPWVSMQYVDGQTIQEASNANQIRTEEAVECIQKIVSAVQLLHDEGIIHRDIKPSNIMESKKGNYLLSDFGIARPSPSLSINQVDSKGFAGTVLYASPEQLEDSSKVVEASDVYSLGATLYHLLSGRAPFRASTLEQTKELICERLPTSIREFNPDVSEDLEAICFKCLAKSPRDRYATVTQLSEDLENWQQGRPTVARPLGWASRLYRWAKREPVVSTLLASCLLLLAGITATMTVAYSNAVANATRLQESSQKQKLSLEIANGLGSEILDHLNGQLPEHPIRDMTRSQLEAPLSEYIEKLQENNLYDLSDQTAARLRFELGFLLYQNDKQEVGDLQISEAEKVLDACSTLDPFSQITLAKIKNHQGIKLAQAKKTDEAISLFDRALQLIETSAISNSETANARALVLTSKASALNSANRFNEALDVTKQNRWGDETWHQIQPRILFYTGLVHAGAIRPLLLSGELDTKTNIAEHQKQVEYWTKAEQLYPQYSSFQFQAGSAKIPYSALLSDIPEESIKVRRESVKQLYSVCWHHPQRRRSRTELFKATANAIVGELGFQCGEIDEAKRMFEMVLPLAMEMELKFADDVAFVSGYGQLLHQAALIADREGERELAMERVQKAATYLRTAAKEMRDDEIACKNCGVAVYDLAKFWRKTDVVKAEALALEAANWMGRTKSNWYLQDCVEVAKGLQQLAEKHREASPERYLVLIEAMQKATRFQVFQAIEPMIQWYLKNDEPELALKLLDKCNAVKNPAMSDYLKRRRPEIEALQ